jgi:putative ABC transport system substrate-binding protein
MGFSAVGIITLVLGILAGPPVADAQRPPTVPRIGFLSVHAGPSPRLEAFQQGLRELGYVEGRNIGLEYRWAAGSYDRLPDLAAELVRLKVDIIVAGGTPAAQAAKNATSTIPIVFVELGDPVESGLVASFGRPGGNLTGLSILAPELSGKRLEVLTEVVPGVTHVAALANPANPAVLPQVKETQVAARALGVQLQLLEARDPHELDNAFSAMTRERPEALIVVPDGLLYTHRNRIADFAVKSRLPVLYPNSLFMDSGALISYGPSHADQYRRAATYVDKILKGDRPADLPVEQPMKFELVLNLKTAKALGITMPPSLLLLANEVIQ